MNYVFKLKRETGIVGNLRFVLLCIARWVRKGYYESRPIALAELSRMTGIDERSVRRCRDELIKREEIAVGKKGRGRGRFQTYVMLKIAGPLFIVDGALKVDSASGFMASEKLDTLSEKTGQVVTEPRENRQKPGSLSRKTGQSVTVEPENRTSRRRDLRDLSTKDLSSRRSTTASQRARAAKPPVAAEVYDQALTFLDWWLRTYPEHNGGARTTLDLERDGPLIAALLQDRPVDRLQAMALVLWTITEREDQFIFDSDRSLKMLRHAGDRLDRYAVARARTAAVSESVADTVWDDVSKSLKNKINRHSFYTWFGHVRFVEDRGGALVLEAPNDLTVQWIQRHFADVLQEALNEVRPGLGVIFRAAASEVSA